MMTDEEITKQNHKLLSLTEHPVWGTFVQIVKEDLDALDSISTLIVGGKDRDELVREVEVRYHTREKLISYINSAIERSNIALDEQEESKDDIINRRY